MRHPLRTLLYELLIEPMFELWQRMRGLLYPWHDPGTTIGDPVASSNLTDPAALPTRPSLPKPWCNSELQPELPGTVFFRHRRLG